MCILCNLPLGNTHGEDFLRHLHAASSSMRLAEESMLAVSLTAITGEDRSRYNAHHKAMVRARKAWNKLEQKREAK